MSEHTHGPWRIEGTAAATIEAVIYGGVFSRCIAELPSYKIGQVDEEARANAALIAAAPDLLAALEQIIAECAGDQMAYRVHGIAATAIAKTKGED